MGFNSAFKGLINSKIVHLLGFTIKIYHDERAYDSQISVEVFIFSQTLLNGGSSAC